MRRTYWNANRTIPPVPEKSEFREKVYTITIPNIAGYKMHFVFTTSIVKSAHKRWNTDTSRIEDAAALHHGTAGGHSWMIFKEDVKVSTLVHECWHAVYAMLKWADIPLDNNELTAYTLGYVVSQGQNFHMVNDQKRRKK